MKTQLLEAGQADAAFEPGDGRVIQGAEMARLCRTLSALEDSVLALERRGISLRATPCDRIHRPPGCRSTTYSWAHANIGLPRAASWTISSPKTSRSRARSSS